MTRRKRRDWGGFIAVGVTAVLMIGLFNYVQYAEKNTVQDEQPQKVASVEIKAKLIRSGETLFIQGNKVNVRNQPSTKAPVVMQLNRGHKLIVLGQQGSWINVGIDKAGGKDGWVHGSLVGPQHSGGKTTAPPNEKFEKFRAAVEHLDAKVFQAAGVHFFTKVEDLGDGIVAVTATNTWISASHADREGNLLTLFNLWDAAEGSGLPIMVRVVDGNGKLIMSKAR
jgi:SH3-like domain-containing protein